MPRQCLQHKEEILYPLLRIWLRALLCGWGYFCWFSSSWGALLETVGPVDKSHKFCRQLPWVYSFPELQRFRCMMLNPIICLFGLQGPDYRSILSLHILFNLCAGSYASGFRFSHQITQINDFSFPMIIFYFWEMFLTLLSNIGSRVKEWNKMKKALLLFL